MSCTRYEMYDRNDCPNPTPCKCPVCGGFLKWIKSDTPVCNKCKTELIMLPDIDEETGEEQDWVGKICPIEDSKTLVRQIDSKEVK